MQTSYLQNVTFCLTTFLSLSGEWVEFLPTCKRSGKLEHTISLEIRGFDMTTATCWPECWEAPACSLTCTHPKKREDWMWKWQTHEPTFTLLESHLTRFHPVRSPVLCCSFPRISLVFFFFSFYRTSVRTRRPPSLKQWKSTWKPLLQQHSKILPNTVFGKCALFPLCDSSINKQLSGFHSDK